MIVIKITFLSCASNTYYQDNSYRDSKLFQEPQIEYHFDKMPNNINVIFFTSKLTKPEDSIIQGFLNNYYSNLKLYNPEILFLRITEDQIKNQVCKKETSRISYPVIIDLNKDNSELKKKCLREIIRDKGLLVSIYKDNEISQNWIHQISFDKQKEEYDFLNYARSQQSNDILLIKNQDVKEDSYIEDSWKSLKGNIKRISILEESKTYENLISESLSIDRSIDRKKILSYKTSLNLGFSPRRRSDVDSIIINTNIDQAKSINPAIAYNFSEDLNIYYINTQEYNYQFNLNNRDLNGVTLFEYPINIINEDIINRNDIEKVMYATGFDIFEIYLLINNKSTKRRFSYLGLSGQFKINSTLSIERKRPLLKINQDRFKVITP